MAEQMTFFRSYYEAVKDMDDGTRLEFLEAVIRYGLYGETPEKLSPIPNMAFTLAFPSLQKSVKRGEASRENGSRGGRPRKEPTKNLTETYEKPNDNLKKPVDYRHKTIDKDIDIDNKTIDIDFDLNSQSQKRGDFVSKRKEEVEAVLNAWNSIPNIPSVKMLDKNTERYKMLCARLDKYGLDAVLEAVSNIRHSTFLCGGGDKGWHIDFGWFVRPNNFPKVYEGKYSDTVEEHLPKVSRAISVIDDMIAKGLISNDG